MLLIVVLLYSAISVAMIFAGYVTKSKFSFEQSNGMMKKSWTPCSMKRFYSYKFSFSQARSRKRFAATDKTLEKKKPYTAGKDLWNHEKKDQLEYNKMVLEFQKKQSKCRNHYFLFGIRPYHHHLQKSNSSDRWYK